MADGTSTCQHVMSPEESPGTMVDTEEPGATGFWLGAEVFFPPIAGDSAGH